ncbi:hypothetical protein JOC77_000548 [Peribacillus deserti]|uniref:Uncharacterized protein n=1 Tax=Peribacillus deserti TaxID=673318 RepID=A0ABS2QDB5_9BACI|nr:hypothetical protein [Peribacillus deserti]
MAVSPCIYVIVKTQYVTFLTVINHYSRERLVYKHIGGNIITLCYIFLKHHESSKEQGYIGYNFLLLLLILLQDEEGNTPQILIHLGLQP